jgi:uncharacterized lipoprotein YbaY
MKTNLVLVIWLVISLSLVACKKQAAKTPAPPTVSVIQPVAREVVEWASMSLTDLSWSMTR